jgi:hypothetical protein
MKTSPKSFQEIINELYVKFGKNIFDPINMGEDEHGHSLWLPRIRVENPDEWYNIDPNHQHLILKNFIASMQSVSS